MEFQASVNKQGIVEVKAVVEKKGNDVIVHVPSYTLLNKLTTDYNGKRDI